VAVEFWTPKEGLLDRAKRDAVPYDLWVQQGHITATPGRAIDYRWVAVRLGELQHEIGLRRVAFDPYRIKYLEKALEEEGVELELVPHGQGFYKAAESGLWMPHSIEVFEKKLAGRRPRAREAEPGAHLRRGLGGARDGPEGEPGLHEEVARPHRRHRGGDDGGRPGG
jgi:hypothetical protein